MIPPGRGHSLGFTLVTGILLSGALLFMLFVYPNPSGTVFAVLRLVVVILTGFLFIQLYRTKPAAVRSDRRPGETDGDKRGRIIDVETEEELKRSAQMILDLYVSAYPEFSASLFLLDARGEGLVQGAFSGKKNAFKDFLPLDKGPVVELMRSTSVQFITPNTGEEIYSLLFKEGVKLPPSTSVLVSPIVQGQRSKGLLMIQAQRYRDFESVHRDSAISYAALLATAMERNETLLSLRSDNLFWSHLEGFQRDLDIVHSFDELIAAFVRFCKLNFSFDKLTFSLLDKSDSGSREAVVVAVSGMTEDISTDDRFPVEGTLHGTVISEGKGLRVGNLLKAKNIQGRLKKGDLAQTPFRSFVGAPIKGNHDVAGAIVLESFEPNKYTDLDFKMLTLVAARAGLLHEWWTSYDLVREAGRRDGLTGLLNYRSFMERFEEEISRAQRYQQSLVLLILDLDKFKKINDSYGHLFGDFVLEEVASVLRNSVRTIDLVARYGGEEFAIVLVMATKRNTAATCKRVISNVAGHVFKKDNVSIRMTISGGASGFPVDGTKPNELIAKADEAMYAVKKKGGNDVGFFPNAS